MTTGHAIARLIRPANALTAVADIAAGWCIAGALAPRHFALLAMSSAFLYMGGIALNDVCDARLDAVERPERVIPSGALKRSHARAVAVALLATGAASAFIVSSTSGVIATALVGAIVMYDALLKRSLVGPAAMGVCRGLNLLLGISAAGAMAHQWAPALLHAIYIAGVTATARRENADPPDRVGPSIGFATLLFTLFAWLALGWRRAEVDVWWLSVFLVVFAMLVAPPAARALRARTPNDIRAAVRAGVLGLIALDAAIAAGFASPVYGLLTLALLPLSMLLSRRFAVT